MAAGSSAICPSRVGSPLAPIAPALRYARFETEGGATFSIAADEVHTAPVVYLECCDLAVTVDYLRNQGITFDQEPRDESWGWREARLRDPAGNTICLYQAGEMRRFPPWRIDDA